MNLAATKKIVQVSEEIQKPVHVPVVLGNECYIITQQDVRKTEDSRFLSYHKLGPNGELIPVETLYGQESALRDAIVIAGGFQNQNQIVTQQLLEMLGKCCGQKQEQEPKNPIKASIAQQMEWASTCNNSSPAFPFTHTTSTSMSDMPHQNISRCCCNKKCCCVPPSKYFIHQGSNTVDNDNNTEHIEESLSARQMLKIRKSIEDTMGL